MLIVADARRLPLRDSCVQCAVTSPPYWGLRDYGAADQIGLEATPAAYVANLVAAFAEVRRVLRDDGTVWLNIGDCYANDGKWGGETGGKQSYLGDSDSRRDGRSKRLTDLKPKDLIGIPWMVAFALRADGWWLRQDVIWHKPNALCESVKDRPTTTHEHLFLLAKSERYHYDGNAIKEPNETGDRPDKWEGRTYGGKGPAVDDGRRNGSVRAYTMDPNGRNKRSVWTVATMPYAGAHFATFPEKLIEPCILAGCPVGGLVCDPFVGSGTVGAVAERLGRRWVGTDLSYQPLASERTAQQGLRW